MIEWISQWLQNIILVVLLATFVDLLLPSSNMQKYSKMVLGLIVILSIITPVFSIFSKDFSVEAITRNIDDRLNQEANVPVMESDQNKVQLNKEYQKKMIEQVQISMKKNLSTILEERFHITVHEVELKADVNESQNWQIQQVQLTIQNGKDKNQTQIKNEIKEIKNIEILPVNMQTNSQVQPQDKKNREENKEEVNQQLQEEIVQVIKEQWGIEEERISVKIRQD